VPSDGANSTLLQSIDFGAQIAGAWRETTVGQGSRLVGASDGTSDDLAAIYLAVREIGAVWEQVTHIIRNDDGSLIAPP